MPPKTCCVLEQPLLASAIIVIGLIEAKADTSTGPQKNRLNSMYNALCRVNSKVLQLLGALMKASPSLDKKRDHKSSLLCCVSLFTSLVTRGQGSQFSDATYFKMISETLREHEVSQKLLEHALSASTLAANSLSSKNSEEVKPSQEESENLMVVKSVLDLMFSVAEVNNPEMLAIIPGAGLSQLVVRNPLFAYTETRWAQHDPHSMPPRGYIISSDKKGTWSKNGSSSFPRFHIGEDDPVHDIWMSSMRVIQASMRCSSHWLSIKSTEPIGRLFFEMSVEFLAAHKGQLLACLKCCGLKLTRNAVLEATYILALIAELCKRSTRDTFIRRCKDLCDEFVNWSKFVAVKISKFLGASGTARELFLAIEEYESADAATDYMPDTALQPRHPLLAEGLPSAKHEAVKYSHFASRCYERVTSDDFEAASMVPSHLASLAKERGNDSDLERACRLSVTNNFAAQIEKTAGDCLSQAISVIWKTHPTSFSFHTFSEHEVTMMEPMGLVQPGVIIGYRPGAGDGLLAEIESTSKGFEKLQFGRVIRSDTIDRTWRVKMLYHGAPEPEGEGNVEVVRAKQLAGIEDASTRMAVATFLPAPNSMTDLENASDALSLGHLILALRWCHQQSLTMKGGALDRGFKTTASVRRIAEQTVALLGAELGIHDEIGSRINMAPKARSRLDAQIFELFADQSILMGGENMENSAPLAFGQEGRLKEIIDRSAWEAVRPQVTREVQRSWKEKQDKERRRKEKRSLSSDSALFSGIRRKGYTQKSAFRGLR
jgi:hypothetical protein